MIARSGGITDSAGGTISIFRPDGPSCPASTEKETNGRFEIKISDLVNGSKEADPLISPGDLVVVEKSPPIYAIGGVRSPRPIPSKEQISLSRLIAMAGGVAKDGDERHIVIYRRTKDGSTRINADLKKIAAGIEKDPELQPLDIVEVMTKGGSARRYPPEIAGPARDKHATLPLVILD
ncbi:MAG: polysaccharide export protein [Acidobacteria bacterium OLB17]|nr:MAG: polysaccharide export protein [Acidobacteria bacterium OLB17]